jgi:PGF-pre-PGF domain-containing protein
MVPFDAELDMQSQGAPGTVVDILNSTTGYYQLAIPGSTASENRSYFIAAYASNNTANAAGTLHFGGFVNVSLSADTSMNITLRPLAGSLALGTNVNTSKVSFNLIDGTNNQSAGQSFVFAEVNYTVTGGPRVEANLIINANSTGGFSIPLYNTTTAGAKSAKLKIFSNRFSPREIVYTPAQITGNASINITLQTFELKSPENVALEATIYFMVSNSTCDVPYPNLATIDNGGCLLSSADDDSFNPLKALAMGKTSLRIQQTSGVTLHYVGVDLLASGPPDAVYNDSRVASTSSSTNLADIWRFGSLGPKIYDKVIIGIPYNESTTNENGTFKMKIPYFYDNDWNVIWNISANDTSQLPDGYGDYNSTTYTGYINGTGITCSKTVATSTCYANLTNNTIWMTIPHFSGTGPEVNGSNDLSGPTLSLTVPSASVELSSSTTISCSASDASGVNVSSLTITKPDSSVVTHTCGSAFTGSDLLGTYTVKYNATDTIGNSNSVTKTFTTIRPGTTGSSGGGGGGGGGAAAPSKKVVNVFTELSVGVVHKVMIKETDIGLKQIFIEVNNKANSVEITVQKLADKPASVTHEISGKVFQYIQIDHKNLNDTNIKSAKIRFNITKSWISSNSINTNTVALNRYTASWQKLATSKIGESDAEIEYEADTPGFSVFAVTGELVTAATTTTTTPSETTATTLPGATTTTITIIAPQGGDNSLFVLLAGFVLVFVVALLYFFGRKKARSKIE